MMTAREHNFLLCGVAEPPISPTVLRAGPVVLEYSEGGLRYLRLGGRELVRRIYIAVRDRNWGTAPARVTTTRLAQAGDAFELACEAECRLGEIDYVWAATIRGESSGRIAFAMTGRARSTFLRNRIGFCVLHPPKECRASRCRVGQADGSTLEASFPDSIAPVSPFTDMTWISHEVRDGLWCRVTFEGDRFEMEDQRNWADASFKSFCTPLRLPFPVEIQAGSEQRQTIVVSLEGSPSPAVTEVAPGPIEITRAMKPALPLPPIGLGAASHGTPLTAREVSVLRRLAPAHLRVELRPGHPEFASQWKTACAQARALGIPIEAVVFVADEAESELATLVRVFASLRPEVCRWLVLRANEAATSDARWCERWRTLLRELDPAAVIGTGTDHSFVEINRRRPPARGIDFVGFSVNPQVHATDLPSLVETLGTLVEIVADARALAAGRPVIVGPVTLRMRSNPAATAAERAPARGELPSPVDPRQLSLFGAAWTLGSLKHLAEGGAAGLTYYETTGWRGVMETEFGSPTPEEFPSLPGQVFPLYHVLSDANEFGGGEIVPCLSSEPLQADALLLRNGRRRRLMLANFSAARRAVAISPSLCARAARLRVTRLSDVILAERTQAGFVRQAPLEETFPANRLLQPFELMPFDVVRIDFEVA